MSSFCGIIAEKDDLRYKQRVGNNMDKKTLEQYGSIKREVEELRKDRAELLASAKEMPVVDTVSSVANSQ